MLDFRTLWGHLAEDSVDEVAEYSPLFRMYMEIFFHTRVVQFMILITAYNVAVLAAANIAYPVMSPFLQFVYYVYDVIGTIVYLALALVFKGSQVFGAHSSAYVANPTKEDTETAKRKIMRNRTVDWIVFCKETIRATFVEVYSLCFGRKVRCNDRRNQERQAVPFYEALNIGLKFLSQRKISGNKRLVLNDWANNAKLVLIFLAIPVYCIVWNFVGSNGPYTFYILTCRSDGRDSNDCLFYQLQMILSLGYLTYITQKAIFTASVLLSLMGLHFGAEVGRGLVDSWINRFGMLRRLEYGERNTPRGGADPVATTPRTAGASAKSLGEPVTNALHQDMRSPPPQSVATENPPTILSPVPMAEVMEYVQRDAYEHYLFIREFMFIGSRAWSPIILTLTFLDTFYVSLFVYGAITAGTKVAVMGWIYFTCWVSIRVLLLTVYPIVSLAHANAYLYVLQEQFLVAAPEDFSVLGGRDGWLQYLEKVPATWTVYGVLITWDRLTGVLWTGVAALGAVAITYASNNV
jgi:hypothetical protein